MWRTLNTQSGTVEDASRWGSNRIQGALRRPRGRERRRQRENSCNDIDDGWASLIG